MINKADVFVRNEWVDGVEVTRMIHQDETSDLNITIARQNEEKIILPSLTTSLIINAPAGHDIKNCPIEMKSDVDMELLYSRTHHRLTIKVLPNDLTEEIPTTMNVTLGEEEPPV